MRQQPWYPCQPARAFTLIESMVAVLLVGIAATAFTSALAAGTQQNQVAVRYVVATNLATAMMNEILSRPFTDPDTPAACTPGPEAGETVRSGFDNVDDYHGLIEPGGQMHGLDGALLSDSSLAGYSRNVTAAYASLPGRDPSWPPAFILVSVEVKYNGMSLVTLKRLISSQERR